MVQKNNVYESTSEGYQRLKEELDDLKNVQRKEIIQAIQEARAQGDLSENADYDAARDEQARIEARIKEIENILKNIKIIKKDSTDTVTAGKTVQFEYVESKKVVEYKFVGTFEVDPKNFKISVESPIGKALFGCKVNDIVHVKSETGKEFEIKILNISNS